MPKNKDASSTLPKTTHRISGHPPLPPLDIIQALQGLSVTNWQAQNAAALRASAPEEQC
jgi:hypothetical protein